MHTGDTVSNGRRKKTSQMGKTPRWINKKVEVRKRVWRPQMKSTCIKPEFKLDPSSSLDWIYEGRGKVLAKERNKLPPRTDLIMFDKDKHEKELTKELQFQDCPPMWQPVINTIVRMFWDVFTGRTSKPNPRISIFY
jgi:hypothetical protein